jgi:hypothetical protein
MRRIFLLSILLIIFFGLLSSIAVVVGRQMPTPPHVADMHLKDCELPCWIGIVPQKTTIQEAAARLYEVYGREPDKRIDAVNLTRSTSTYTISDKSQGRLMTIHMLTIPNNSEVVDRVEVALHKRIQVGEIYTHWLESPLIQVGGHYWNLHFPKWQIEGIAGGGRCNVSDGIKANDYVFYLFLGKSLGDIAQSVRAVYWHDWQGFRTCYPQRVAQ